MSPTVDQSQIAALLDKFTIAALRVAVIVAVYLSVIPLCAITVMYITFCTAVTTW